MGCVIVVKEPQEIYPRKVRVKGNLIKRWTPTKNDFEKFHCNIQYEKMVKQEKIPRYNYKLTDIGQDAHLKLSVGAIKAIQKATDIVQLTCTLTTVNTVDGFENKSIDWYNNTWKGTPKIDKNSNKITCSNANITYFTEYDFEHIQQISFKLNHNSSDSDKTVGLYDPTTNQWIGYISNDVMSNQGVNEFTGFTSTTEITDDDIQMKDGVDNPIKMVLDNGNLEITYTALSNNRVTVKIPIGYCDVSHYYFAVKDESGVGLSISNIEGKATIEKEEHTTDPIQNQQVFIRDGTTLLDQVLTDEKGQIKYNFSSTHAGTHPLTFYTKFENGYNPTQATYNVNVLGQSYLSLSPRESSTTHNSSIPLTITLHDAYNNPITGQHIKLYESDRLLDTGGLLTNQNGQIIFDYSESSDNGVFVIMDVHIPTVIENQDTIIKGTVRTSKKELVKKGRVYLYADYNATPITQQDITNGNFSLKCKFTNHSKHKIHIIYRGVLVTDKNGHVQNTEYEPSMYSTTIHPYPSPEIILSPSKLKYKVQETVTFRVNVSDSDGTHNWKGEKIYLYYRNTADKTVSYKNILANLDATGNCTITWKTITYGSYEFYAFYGGSSVYASNRSKTAIVEITPKSTNINTTIPSNIRQASVCRVSSVLTCEGKPLPYTIIQYSLQKMNGTPSRIGVNQTNDKGISVFEFTPHEAGKHILISSFEDDHYYSNCKDTDILNISKQDYDITIEASNYVYTSVSFPLKISVTHNNIPLRGVLVTLSDGTSYSKYYDCTSFDELTLIPQSNKEYAVTHPAIDKHGLHCGTAYKIYLTAQLIEKNTIITVSFTPSGKNWYFMLMPEETWTTAGYKFTDAYLSITSEGFYANNKFVKKIFNIPKDKEHTLIITIRNNIVSYSIDNQTIQVGRVNWIDDTVRFGFINYDDENGLVQPLYIHNVKVQLPDNPTTTQVKTNDKGEVTTDWVFDKNGTYTIHALVSETENNKRNEGFLTIKSDYHETPHIVFNPMVIYKEDNTPRSPPLFKASVPKDLTNSLDILLNKPDGTSQVILSNVKQVNGVINTKYNFKNLALGHYTYTYYYKGDKKYRSFRAENQPLDVVGNFEITCEPVKNGIITTTIKELVQLSGNVKGDYGERYDGNMELIVDGYKLKDIPVTNGEYMGEPSILDTWSDKLKLDLGVHSCTLSCRDIFLDIVTEFKFSLKIISNMENVISCTPIDIEKDNNVLLEAYIPSESTGTITFYRTNLEGVHIASLGSVDASSCTKDSTNTFLIASLNVSFIDYDAGRYYYTAKLTNDKYNSDKESPVSSIYIRQKGVITVENERVHEGMSVKIPISVTDTLGEGLNGVITVHSGTISGNVEIKEGHGVYDVPQSLIDYNNFNHITDLTWDYNYAENTSLNDHAYSRLYILPQQIVGMVISNDNSFATTNLDDYNKLGITDLFIEHNIDSIDVNLIDDVFSAIHSKSFSTNFRVHVMVSCLWNDVLQAWDYSDDRWNDVIDKMKNIYDKYAIDGFWFVNCCTEIGVQTKTGFPYGVLKNIISQFKTMSTDRTLIFSVDMMGNSQLAQSVNQDYSNFSKVSDFILINSDVSTLNYVLNFKDIPKDGLKELDTQYNTITPQLRNQNIVGRIPLLTGEPYSINHAMSISLGDVNKNRTYLTAEYFKYMVRNMLNNGVKGYLLDTCTDFYRRLSIKPSKNYFDTNFPSFNSLTDTNNQDTNVDTYGYIPKDTNGNYVISKSNAFTTGIQIQLRDKYGGLLLHGGTVGIKVDDKTVTLRNGSTTMHYPGGETISLQCDLSQYSLGTHNLMILFSGNTPYKYNSITRTEITFKLIT